MRRTVRYAALPIALGFFAAFDGGCLYLQLPPAHSARIVDNWHASYKVRVGFAHGSGVVLSEDGYILTAAHVVAADPIIDVQIQTAPNRWETRGARLVAVDRVLDLAVVKADGRFNDVVVLGDVRRVEPGDWIYAVGYPYELEQVVSRGYVLKTRSSFIWGDTGRRVNNVILLDLFGGQGASGEGIFAERDGCLIGILIGHMTVGQPTEPASVVRWATGVDDIRDFLDKNGIPYLYE